MKTITTKVARKLVLASLFLTVLLVANVDAQTIDLDIATTEVEIPHFVNGELVVDYDASDFSTNPSTTYYLFYTDGNPFIYDDWSENIIGTSTNASDLLTYNWPSSGIYNIYIAGLHGDFNSQNLDLSEVGLNLAGTNSDPLGSAFLFDRPGVRSFTSEPYDLIGQQARFTFFLQTNMLEEANEIVVEYSNNGTDWSAMTSILAEDSYFGNSSGTHSFDIPFVSATTQVRIRQVNSNNLAINTSLWYVEDAIFELGNPVVIENAISVGSYNVSNLQIQTIEILDENDDDITNGSVFPGAQIQVIAQVDGYDIDDYNYTAVILDDNGNVYRLTGVTVNTSFPEVTVSGTVPRNIPYDLNSSYINDVYVLAYEGSVLRLGLLASENDGTLPYTLQGGVLNAGGFEFNQEDERNVTTGPLVVNSASNSYLSFYLQRIHNFRSPEGTEIVVEYTTNGIAYTQLLEIDLNTLSQELVPGILYDHFTLPIPVGAVSSNTQFRIRQLDNNGLDLDVWFVDDLEISVNSNINESIIDYVSVGLDVLTPTLDLATINIPDGLSYPGESLPLSFTVSNGLFPNGTMAQAHLITGGLFNNLLLGSVIIDNLGTNTINFTVPAILEDDYEVYVSTATGVQSNSVYLPVYGLQLTIEEVQSADGVQEGADNILYPGSEITVLYSINGDLPTGIQLDAQVYDYNSTNYITVASTTTINGSIDLILPTGINYNFGVGGDPKGNLDIRLVLGEGALASNSLASVADVLWNFPLDNTFVDTNDRQGNYGPNDSYFGLTGVRIAKTYPYNVKNGGSVIFFLEGQNFAVDQKIRLEGSTDGITWSLIEEFDFFNGLITGLSSTIPHALWSENTTFRFIFNEDGAAAFDQNILHFQGIQVNAYESQTAAQALFSTDHILQLSVSQSTLADPDFLLGEETQIHFNTDGPFPDNTMFAVVLENSLNENIYKVLATTESQGAVSIGVQMPYYALDEEDNNLFDQLRIVPFLPANTSDTYRRDIEIELDESDDFILVVGESTYNPLDDYNQFQFSSLGSRSILTKAIDLETASEATISFYIELYDLDINSNILTLPRLQVSIDGGNTFEDLPTHNGNQLGNGVIYHSHTLISASIPQEYLTEATHFKIYQPLNLGQGQEDWYISDLEITIGNSNELDEVYYDNFQNPQGITLNEPTIAHYNWYQENNNDPIFNGDSFEFNWTKTFAELEGYPAGTTFTFTADFVDQQTDEEYILAIVTDEGLFEAGVPAYVEAGDYSIRVFVNYIDEDQTYVYNFIDGDLNEINDGYVVGNIRVYNRVLRTSVVVGNEVIYAGEDATFSVDFENDVTADDLAYYNSLYFNLLVHFDGFDWLLAVQEGYQDDFMVALPPFITGTPEFRVEVTEGSPIGVIGEIVQNPTYNLLENNLTKANNFINIDEIIDAVNSVDGEAILLDVSGIRQLTTKSLNTNAIDVIEYTIYFDQDVANLTIDQQVVFEFSTNNGATYAPLHTYPNADLGDDDTQTVRLLLTEEMKSDNIKFRFRQNESKGSLAIYDFNLISNDIFPFETLGVNPEIKLQGIEVTGFDADSYCSNEPITLHYNIKGRFGENNIMHVLYFDEFDNQMELEGQEFTISEGSGSVEINLPEDFFVGDYNNKTLKFALRSTDHTFEHVGSEYGLGYDPIELEEDETPIGNNNYGPIMGTFSELPVEIVAPINYASGIGYLPDASEFDCGISERFVVITAPQNNFRYAVRNKVTGAVLGTLVYHSESGIDYVSIGLVDSRTQVEVVATALSSDGLLECESQLLLNTDGLSNAALTFDIRPEFTIHYMDASGVWLPAQGHEFNVCQGNTDLSLAALYYDADGLAQFAPVKWYRALDPVGFISESTILNTFDQPGEYLASISTLEGCTYASDMVTINLIDSPLRPEITADGNPSFCEGGSVTLSGPVGFEFYEWQRNGVVLANANSNEIVVNTNGIYSLSVANGGCFSPVSLNLPITVYSIPQAVELWADNTLVIEGYTHSTCQEEVELFANSVGYPTRWFRNGVEVPSNNPSDPRYLFVSQSGTYTATIYSDAQLTCSLSTLSVDVNINAVPTTPAIVATLNGVVSTETVFALCDNDQLLRLAAPSGFESYQWRINGNLQNVNSRFIEADRSGNYQLSIGNGTCLSEASAVIQVTLGSLPASVGLFVDGQTVLQGMNYATCEEDFVLTMNVSAATYSTRWFRDGIEIANTNVVSANSLTANQSGVYQGMVFSKTLTSCSISTLSVNVTIETPPIAPSISASLDGVASALTVFEICSNTQELVLSGPTGFNSYQWIRNGIILPSNSRNVVINQSGSYQLSVGNGTCHSELSSVIEAKVGQVPAIASLYVGNTMVEQSNYTACGTNVELYVDANPSNYYIRWFRDGVEVANNNSSTPNYFTATVNGVYSATVSAQNSNSCSMSTSSANITLATAPARPTISAALNGQASTSTSFEFCEGADNLLISVPTGATGYRWYRDEILMSGPSDSPAITVNQSGSYRVSVLSTDLCESERSLPIEVIIQLKPISKNFRLVGGSICESGTAEFEILGASPLEIYQLYRVLNTSPYQLEASGGSVMGNASGETIITSAVLSESTQFVLGIRNNFQNSCEAIYTNETSAVVENVTMDVLGNQLTARLLSNGGISSYQWFRNDAPIANGGNGSSISVFDDAEYRVVVLTSNGCELSISTSELAGDRVLGLNQRLQSQDISLYPNPSSDIMTMKIANAYMGDLTLRVLSLSGQQMMEQLVVKSTNEYILQLSIANLPEGIYMLQIISNNGSEMVRMVRN